MDKSAARTCGFRNIDMTIHKVTFFTSSSASKSTAVIEVFCGVFASNPNAVVKPAAAAAAPPVDEKPQRRQQQHDSDSDVEFSDDERQSTSSDSDFT